MQKIKQIGKVKTESVLKCTGKDWDTWIEILNKNKAANWSHQDLVKFLKTKYKLRPWWQQLVASSYELHIGKRIEGQNLKGKYSTVATKTFSASGKKVWSLLTSPKGIKIWLKPLSDLVIKKGAQYEIYGGIFGEIRTVKAGQRLRLTWQEAEWPKPSILQISIYSKPGKKTMIAFQHESLHEEKHKIQLLKYWKEVLDLMSKILSE